MGGGIRCPYCGSTQGRCATTASGRSVTECGSCGRVVEERHTQLHDLFLLRAHDSPLCLVTPDLSSVPSSARRHHQKSSPTPEAKEEDHDEEDDEDPFEPTGFITAFSTVSLEPTPIFARSCVSFSGHLAELERALDPSSSTSSGPVVVVDNLRAYLQIIDVSSILGLDYDISDHAFQLFRDCSAATCLRNRSVEALATAALVQAIREAQEPRTLQEISIAANLPQKEIGKYIKILGEALQLSQPINSNSISVHMPRFCTLLQLNKSAQELATHIGEVVINKCFCTRRNPISISAAAIYLACQLEDKRKTQAEICKVTGLTEVTLRKVYKELLENWDDLLPPNYTPAVPPEKAFPTTAITSGRSLTSRIDHVEVASSLEKDKQPEVVLSDKPSEISEMDYEAKGKEEGDIKSNTGVPPKLSSASYVAKNNVDHNALNDGAKIWHTQLPFGMPTSKPAGEKKIPISSRGIDINEAQISPSESEQGFDKNIQASTSTNLKSSHSPVLQASNESPNFWPFHHQVMSGSSSHVRFVQVPKMVPGFHELKGLGNQNKHVDTDHSRDAEKR